jgi:hypothetical protein
MRFIVTVVKTAELEIEARDEAEALIYAAAQEAQALIETNLSFHIQPLAGA